MNAGTKVRQDQHVPSRRLVEQGSPTISCKIGYELRKGIVQLEAESCTQMPHISVIWPCGALYNTELTSAVTLTLYRGG
jgi:hypothetical protein